MYCFLRSTDLKSILAEINQVRGTIESVTYDDGLKSYTVIYRVPTA